MERRYQRLCRYEDETLFFVARIKASLESGEELDNDDFVVIEAVVQSKCPCAFEKLRFSKNV